MYKGAKTERASCFILEPMWLFHNQFVAVYASVKIQRAQFSLVDGRIQV